MVMVVYSGIEWHCCNCLCDLKVKNHVLVDKFLYILPHKKEQQWSGLVTLEAMPGSSNCSVSVFLKTDGQCDQNAVHQLHPCTSSDICGSHMNDLSQQIREKEMFNILLYFWCVPLMSNDGHIMQNCAVMPLHQTITKGCLIKT